MYKHAPYEYRIMSTSSDDNDSSHGYVPDRCSNSAPNGGARRWCGPSNVREILCRAGTLQLAGSSALYSSYHRRATHAQPNAHRPPQFGRGADVLAFQESLLSFYRRVLAKRFGVSKHVSRMFQEVRYFSTSYIIKSTIICRGADIQ
jgi:hypothetical protein